MYQKMVEREIKIKDITHVIKSYGCVYVPIDDILSLEIIYNLIVHKIKPVVTSDTDKQILLYLGLYYKNCKDYVNMSKYYLLAINKKCTIAMNNLAVYYNDIKDYENMLKYYLMSINEKNPVAMNNLGTYYDSQKDYEKMKKYYLMAINEKYAISMNNLASYYERHADYVNMKKYYLMAIDHKNNVAMYKLGSYYAKIDIALAATYYLMAIEYEYYKPLKWLLGYYVRNDTLNGIIIFEKLFEKGILNAAIYYVELLQTCDKIILLSFLKTKKNQVVILNSCLKSKNKEVDDLNSYITELELAPEGPKYKEAREHFESICNTVFDSTKIE
jgi:tetratricopeptide (TPR) repeat protein